MTTETERQKVSRLMYLAFVDVRALILDGQSQQAKDLAEAFQDFLERYQQKYAAKARYNYLQEWEKLNTAAQ